MNRIAFLAAGAVFGFLLSRARATDYDTIVAMFRFADLHLMGVMGVAIAVAAAGLFALRRSGGRTAFGGAVELHPKPFHRGAILGGLVFGAGWALTGACPGTAAAQLGEGKLLALLIVAGMILGTYLFEFWKSRVPTTPAVERAPAPAVTPR